jgi:hypothetical protein
VSIWQQDDHHRITTTSYQTVYTKLRILNPEHPDFSLVYRKFCRTILAVAWAVVDRQIDQILDLN